MNNYLSALLADEQPTAGVSFGGGLPIEGKGQGNAFADVNLSGIQSARHRADRLESGLMFAKDAFDYITGLDPNAYAGKTAKLMNDYEKTRMEEDPEGYQADVNRAKVLSQRAYNEKDPEIKKKYGAAIKRLLPMETQGLDDLTASEFLVSSEKMEIEKLKAATKLKQEEMKGAFGLQKQNLANESKEAIQDAKSAVQRDIAAENNAYRLAIAEGKYDNAYKIQQMRNESAKTVAELNNAAKLQQETMRQEGQTERENIKQGGANYRANLSADTALKKTEMQQKGALERAQIMQDGALERAKISAAAKAKGNTPEKATALQMKVAPDRLKQMKELNESAGRWETNMYDPNDPKQTWWTRQNIASRIGRDYGISFSDNDKDAQSYQQFEGMAKQIVQDQLRQIYGSQFTEKEGERFFQSMGLSPLVDKKIRWSLFMDAINDLRVKNGYAAIDPETFEEVGGGASTQQTQSSGVTRTGGRRVF